MSTKLLYTHDADEWRAALPASRSVFGSHNFALVQERDREIRPALLLAEHDGERVAYPLLIKQPPWDLPDGSPACDAASPPFTGPLDLSGERTEAGVRPIMDAALAQLGVVADFAHLHPWRSRSDLLGGVEVDREVIWVDTTLDEEALWRDSLSHSCRKNIRRAEREGVAVREARDHEDIGEFHRIYEQTMERNQALPGYRFGRDYFEAIFDELAGNARFALAEHDGRVIAATLYLHDDEDVYSYLGGADHDHQALRPTNAVVHETIRWARAEGKRRLILGGGYRPGDGIERFKASFSPLRAELRLARSVRRADAYEELVSEWSRRHGRSAPGDGFFPAYRAQPS